jgi:hypothetical protein
MLETLYRRVTSAYGRSARLRSSRPNRLTGSKSAGHSRCPEGLRRPAYPDTPAAKATTPSGADLKQAPFAITVESIHGGKQTIALDEPGLELFIHVQDEHQIFGLQISRHG